VVCASVVCVDSCAEGPSLVCSFCVWVGLIQPPFDLEVLSLASLE
jgi:hypothetical protein